MSAFNNVGFSLMRNGFGDFTREPVVLVLISLLVLHGNVLYPPLLRWTIVALSAMSPPTSNRKIYFRYLLLHGRRLTPCLFSSQQNWLLVFAQLAMFVAQVVVLLILCWRDEGLRGLGAARKFSVAAFEAINTRHAGMSVVPLVGLRAAALMLQLLMMYLAPVPFVVALRQSAVPRRRLSGAVGDVRAVASCDDLASAAAAAGDGDAAPVRPSAEVRRRYVEGRRLSLGPSVHHSESPLRAMDRNASRAASHLSTTSQAHDAMVDTREILIERYPDSAPPWRARVDLRAKALGFHIRRGLRGAVAAQGFARDAAALFLAWFLIAAIMQYTADGHRHSKALAGSDDALAAHEADGTPVAGSGALFYIIFELTSAFGNVGLSLGSIDHPDRPVGYSGDLSTAALFIVGLVQIFGRTRDMPATVDSALSVPTVDAKDVLRQSLSLADPANACAVEDVEDGAAPAIEDV